MRTVPPPHSSPSKPTYALPRHACDTHVHIYGPTDRFPYDPDRPYDAPEAPAQALENLHLHLGVDRVVIVQATVHGTDNRAMLDAIARRPDSARGVALVADDATDNELQTLHAGGVRGLRYNFMPHLGHSADPRAVLAMARRVAPLGWHVQLHVQAEHLAELHPFLSTLPVPYVIDHMGRPMVRDGLEQPALTELLRVLEDEQAWLKISGPERISEILSQGPIPYGDVVPFVQSMLAVAEDRIVWGTDWPHPNVREVPDDGKLVDLLPRYADAGVLHKVLVDNPARLYGF